MSIPIAPTAPDAALSNAPILLSPPDVGPVEEEYLLRAMRGGWIAPAGPDLHAFEHDVAGRVGVDHAVALSSGTAALHLGLLGLGVQPGDRVVTATLTFAATANAITYCGAAPVFVDCDSSGNMDPQLLHHVLTRLRRSGTRVGAILPVDVLGKSADYGRLLPIAHDFGIPVLADAAESLGACHGGVPAGSFGAAAAISFNGNKVMTTSGGGMLLTDDASVAEYVRYLSTQAREPGVHYEHRQVGFNYRMSNLLAAVGRAQLTRLDAMLSRRRHVRARYRHLFAPAAGVRILGGSDDGEDNAWLTAILVDSDVAGWQPAHLAEWLAADGIETRPVWKPMHLQPAFAGHHAELNGTAEQIHSRGLTLPSGSVLSEADIDRVHASIQEFLRISAASVRFAPTCDRPPAGSGDSTPLGTC